MILYLVFALAVALFIIGGPLLLMAYATIKVKKERESQTAPSETP